MRATAGTRVRRTVESEREEVGAARSCVAFALMNEIFHTRPFARMNIQLRLSLRSGFSVKVCGAEERKVVSDGEEVSCSSSSCRLCRGALRRDEETLV